MNALELLDWAYNVDQNFDVMPADWKLRTKNLLASPQAQTVQVETRAVHEVTAECVEHDCPCQRQIAGYKLNAEMWAGQVIELQEQLAARPAPETPAEFVSVGYQYKFPSFWGGVVWRDSPSRHNGSDYTESREGIRAPS